MWLRKIEKSLFVGGSFTQMKHGMWLRKIETSLFVGGS